MYLSPPEDPLMQRPQAFVDSKLHCHVWDVFQQGWQQTLHGIDDGLILYCFAEPARDRQSRPQLQGNCQLSKILAPHDSAPMLRLLYWMSMTTDQKP